MALVKIISLEEAINKLKDKSLEITHKPVVIGVYGVPDHGKTYFMKKFQDKVRVPYTYSVMCANALKICHILIMLHII